MMEDQEQHNERVRNDIDELKGGMSKMMEMLQVLTATKEGSA